MAIMQNTNIEPETYASYWIRKYEVPAASYRIMRPTAGRMLLNLKDFFLFILV